MSISVASNLQTEHVTATIIEATAADALESIARTVGVDVAKQGEAFIVGELRATDRGVLVERCERLNPEDVETAINVALSDIGETRVYKGGVIVVSDRVSVLRRVRELIKELNHSDSPSWCVQLYIASLDESALRDLGIDTTPAAKVAISLAGDVAGSGLGVPLGLGGFIDASLESVLTAAAENGHGELVAEPLFLLTDDEQASFLRGKITPVPRRTVSAEGTVETTGYDEINTGLSIDVTARALADDLCRVSVQLEISEVVAIIEGAPERTADQFQTVADVKDGGSYLLGSIARQRKRQDRRKWLSVGRTNENEATNLYVFAKIYRTIPSSGFGPVSDPSDNNDGDQPSTESSLLPLP
ncbi:Bacterial type II and III secretion system protein [Calycomorphotria hydatis]|uniref:Bacterial type II and III secretion system protein n=1 Tax=Calycomorphotria hydatis TaxID=2528027 RepID=A0A517TBQ7_9PLAN|nr:Bacterial type II and III secretion system protein [Calycomorphotria hydatis]